MNPAFLVLLLPVALASSDNDTAWYQNRTEVGGDDILVILNAFEKSRIQLGGPNDMVFIPRFRPPVIDFFPDVSRCTYFRKSEWESERQRVRERDGEEKA
jgi:hypothetical protein